MGNILNIAHRGFTKIFPDNTLEAFQAAIEIGVDGIECDIQETADRRFVVFHDSDLFGVNIGKLSLAQIESAKPRGKFKIPTLEETLDLCKKRVKVVVELKQVQSLDVLLRLLKSRVQLDDVVIASFRQDLLSNLLQLAPETHRAVIVEGRVRDPIGITELAQSHIVIVKCPFVTAELVRTVHSHSISLLVWGCAGPTEIRDSLKFNIDGIISDSPDLVLDVLRTMT